MCITNNKKNNSLQTKKDRHKIKQSKIMDKIIENNKTGSKAR